MLQRFLTYFISAFILFIILYLAFWIWWLLLPVFAVLMGLAAWRVYQARKLWNNLLKQAQNTKTSHKQYRKVADDNIIDVEYEEIKQ